MKRQILKWKYLALYAKNTFLRAGLYYNKSKGNPKDIVRLQIHGKNTDVDFTMRPDEAITIIWALSKVLWIWEGNRGNLRKV